MIDLDDQLAAIAAGDPDAFGRWVAGAEHELRASLASFAAAVDSEVIVQETLLRMWQVAPRVERDGRQMNYRADLDGFRAVVTYLAQDCCDGRGDLCTSLVADIALERPAGKGGSKA